MNKTIVYLVRHAEQFKNTANILNVSESPQINNEKIILSINGEKNAEKISNLDELSNIDILYSSNYVRAISTAKYIADKNNIDLNIDSNFNERKLGDLESLNKLRKNKKFKYTTEQLLDENLKNINGESRIETTERFFKSFNSILKNNQGKRIVIVSHGASIKFALLKWCSLNYDTHTINFKGTEIAKEKLNSPEIFKLEFDKENIINISLISY